MDSTTQIGFARRSRDRPFTLYGNSTTMVWPARSPDLNPIEHVWDMLGTRSRGSDPRPNSLAEVRNRLVEIWENLDQNDIRAEIESMRRRCQAVIRARGGNTRY
jgi:hypothetical protein